MVAVLGSNFIRIKFSERLKVNWHYCEGRRGQFRACVSSATGEFRGKKKVKGKK
jgi:hypothetical protein